jgi:biotin operon repressor
MPRPRDYSATERVYDAIVSFIADNHYPPSQIEIGDMLDKGRTAVAYHLQHLVADGRIRLVSGKKRGIVVIK